MIFILQLLLTNTPPPTPVPPVTGMPVSVIVKAPSSSKTSQPSEVIRENPSPRPSQTTSTPTLKVTPVATVLPIRAIDSNPIYAKPVAIAPKITSSAILFPTVTNPSQTLILTHVPQSQQSGGVLSSNSSTMQLVVTSSPTLVTNVLSCSLKERQRLIAPAPMVMAASAKSSESQADARKRTYQCTYSNCLKTYFKSSHLKAHFRTHTGNCCLVC